MFKTPKFGLMYKGGKSSDKKKIAKQEKNGK